MKAWLSQALDTADAHPLVTRWILAGPGALVLATLFMAAMPVWLPAGDAGVNNIVYPLVLAPLFWALAFLYAVLEGNLRRGVAITTGGVLLQGAVLALALL